MTTDQTPQALKAGQVAPPENHSHRRVSDQAAPADGHSHRRIADQAAPVDGHSHHRATDQTAGADGARALKKRAWGFGLVIALSLLLIAAYYAARQSDSWIIHWKRHTVVRDLASLYVRIHATGLPVAEIGRVEIDGAWLPLLALRRAAAGGGSADRERGASGAGSARARMCVFSGVHGNEPATVEAALRFAESLRGNANLYAGIDITIVPLVNPWGWARNLRRNSANQDISRTFVMSPSVEGEIVKRLLQNERCTLVTDLHGDSTKQPFHIITFDNPDLGAAKAVTSAVAGRGLPLRKGAAEGVFHRHDKDAVNTSRPNLGLYARRNGVAQVYNIQSPRELEIETRVGVHVLALDHLARTARP